MAFSVAKDWQGKGIAGVLQEKIARAAREKGYAELVAYTNPNNIGMLKLFKKLPYRTKTTIKDAKMVLRCRFEI
jgi:L-amino acid N-acyltransferase YncA